MAWGTQGHHYITFLFCSKKRKEILYNEKKQKERRFVQIVKQNSKLFSHIQTQLFLRKAFQNHAQSG